MPKKKICTMIIPCAPRWIDNVDENLECYKKCRRDGYEFVRTEVTKLEDGKTIYSWVLELFSE